MKTRLGLLAIVALLAGCSGGGNAPVQQSQTQQGGFALQSAAAAGGATRVTLHAQSSAGTIITLVGQLTYDTSRLKVQGCEIGKDVGSGTAAGKALHFAEPVPGTVRTVVEGGLQPLPPNTDVLTCTFAPVPGAPAGAAAIRAEGNVADMSYVDRPFAADGTVKVGNQ